MPKEIISAIPLCFLDQNLITENDNKIVIPDYLLNSWIDFYPHGASTLVKLSIEDTDSSCIVVIGATHTAEGIYVPSWILEQLGIPDGILYIDMEPYLTVG